MLGGEFVRDAAVMAAIFGFAGFAWLGWAQEAPPDRWRVPLGVASMITVATGVVGAVLAWRNWGPESALATESARESFGIVAGIEITVSAIGAVVLAVRKLSRWTSTWICLVVGVHFVPLAIIFEDTGLVVLAIALTLVAAAGVVIARRAALHPSSVVGLGAGAVLWLFALRGVLAVLTA